MKTKILLFILTIFLFIISCKKADVATSSNASENDTVNTINRLDSTISKRDSTFEPVPQSEHDTIKSNYDKIFENTALESVPYQIDGNSFNETVNKYKGKKEFLDIYFILDKKNERNLVFKFTNEQNIGPNYKLINGDDQYIIENRTLKLANNEDLKRLVDSFKSKYVNEIKLLPNKIHTIVTRDTIAGIQKVYGILKIYPCIDNSDKVSLTSEFEDVNGKISYGNRGALYP